ncbi:MAG: VanZ family protein [Ginsengibacter sp.]
MKNKISFAYFLPGIAWFFVVGLLTLMPARDVPEVGWFDKIPDFDKFVHAVLFGGLVILFAIPLFKSQISFRQKVNYAIRVSIAVIVWGITIEFLQKFFVPSRDFDLLDWAADTLGVIVAFWMIVKILKYSQKKNFQ